MKIIFIAIGAILLLFGVFAVAAVIAGAKAEKITDKIHEDEQAKRN